MEDIKISIDKKTAIAILEIDSQYFFNLFKPIRKTIDDEYKYRDSINLIAKAIKESMEYEN